MAGRVDRGGTALDRPNHDRSCSFFSSTVAVRPRFVHLERETVIGGIGRTLRWQFQAPKTTDRAPLVVLVVGVSEWADFEAAGEDLHRLDVSWSAVCEPQRMSVPEGERRPPWATFHGTTSDLGAIPDGWSVLVELSRASDYTRFACVLSERTACQTYISDAERVFTMEYGVERMGRSKWNFLNQDGTVAKPKQSIHKWLSHWAPEDWEGTMPFTWEQLVVRTRDRSPLPSVLADVTHELHAQEAERELSLRAERGLLAFGASDARCDPAPMLVARAAMHRRQQREASQNESSSQRGGGKRRTLPFDNVRELFAALHTTLSVGPSSDRDAFRRAQAVCMAYLLNGFLVRLVGPYEQNANNVGFGRKQRNFKRLKQYHRDNLPTRVLARICRMDGSTGGGLITRRKKKAHATKKEQRQRASMDPAKRVHHTMETTRAGIAKRDVVAKRKRVRPS
jgi:hypothetical protein